MRKLFSTLSILLCTSTAWSQTANPRILNPLESRVESIGLFKNGLAVVRERAVVPADGDYEMAGIPEAVHGTLWVESDAFVDVESGRRIVEQPFGRVAPSSFETDLEGQEVTIYFAEGAIPPVTGRVLGAGSTEGREWNRDYESAARRGWASAWWGSIPSTPTTTTSGFLLLERPTGYSYVDRKRIAHLEVMGKDATVRREEPILRFGVSGVGPEGATITVSYLTKGMAWAPSYLVDVSDPETLVLEQKAVLRNELRSVQDVEVELISGYPSIQFSHVLSPLSSRTDWAGFFRQLNRRLGGSDATMTGQILMQNVAAPRAASPSVDALVSGDSVDLHYQPIGQRSLGLGDSQLLSIGRAEAPYERIVEWIVPDNRGADGRPVSNRNNRFDPWAEEDPEVYDTPWDALRFRNPFSFPMTTGPAMIRAGGRFQGQRVSRWINPGEATTLHVTKALSLAAQSFEEEEESERDLVRIGGRNYRRTTVRGELHLTNYRSEGVQLVLRRRFSGELVQADESPEERLLEEGVWSINKRNELVWTLPLDPGARTVLTYRYEVLVQH